MTLKMGREVVYGRDVFFFGFLRRQGLAFKFGLARIMVMKRTGRTGMA